MGAADTSPLDDSYCLNPLDFCMETKWTLWCFFSGILLAMVSIVLLVNSVALHHKVLLLYILANELVFRLGLLTSRTACGPV